MEQKPIFAYAQLNAKIQPIDRCDDYEDPLEEVLAKTGYAEVSGGGTMQGNSGEISYCGIDIDIYDLEKAIPIICDSLTTFGAPKGSVLSYSINEEKIEIPFGELEGLAIYLNGTELPNNVYEESDINHLWSEIDRLIEGCGEIKSYWQGPTETALYLYGTSAAEMKNLIGDLISDYPLCQKARLVEIA
ncbi:MAG: hypothetical protein NE328_24890 [Lentisphaeraceae bacterium]|nr:hypothetical protein [Lentisphaeraceae bacterium]